MKNALTLILIVCTLPLFAQIDLTAEQWQEDLRYLQHSVHKDYPFLFKKVTAGEFDAAVDQLYQQIPQLSDHEVIVGLARIVALFKYGHTAMGLSPWWHSERLGFHQLPFNLYAFEDGIYIQGVHKKYAEALGARVRKVAGMPLAEALTAVRPTISVENDQYFKAFGINALGNVEVLHAQGVTDELKESVTLTLEKEGKTFDMAFEAIQPERFPGRYSFIEQQGDWLDARQTGEMPLWRDKLDRIYYYKYLPEHKAVYVRHSQIQDDDEQAIPDFYQEVFDFVENNDVERFILDVRLNGGGNNYKNKPIVTGLLRSKKINQPGRLFVILGRRTYSACQNLVNELHNYTNAIFVGEPTSENINFYGDSRTVTLPNSQLPAHLSFAWWQDKPQWENGPWLAPQLAVGLSFEDYLTNRDPVLEAIFEYDPSDPVLTDPMRHLRELFMAGKLDMVRSEARRLVEDPRYKYTNFESQFNRAGYDLLEDDRVQEAVFVFQLNSELYPDSANVWDSLAEGYWKAGDKEKAEKYYQKAISMDPDGPTGHNARSMLEKMRE